MLAALPARQIFPTLTPITKQLSIDLTMTATPERMQEGTAALADRLAQEAFTGYVEPPLIFGVPNERVASPTNDRVCRILTQYDVATDQQRVRVDVFVTTERS